MTRGRFFLALAILVALSYGGYKMTRGLRNNNPGNIRYNSANQWHGQTGQDADGFAIFARAEDGIDAIGEILDSYQRRGVRTIEEIITTWAPPAENNTQSYLRHVLQLTGWPSGFMPVRSEGDYQALVKAIIKHENGIQPYSDEMIAESLALVT